MGCLNVRIQRVNGLHTGFSPMNSIDVQFENKNSLESKYTSRNDITARYEKKSGVKVNFYFVCRVGTREFIRVSPEEPIWITMDEMGVYTVRSNTDWIVL